MGRKTKKRKASLSPPRDGKCPLCFEPYIEWLTETSLGPACAACASDAAQENQIYEEEYSELDKVLRDPESE